MLFLHERVRLTETHSQTVPKWKEIEDKSRASSVESSQNGYKHDPHTQIAFRDLLTFPVVISIANYVTLAFLNISVNALLPLFFHMPIELGGLDLDPATIGYVMGLYGAGTGAFQIVFFAKLVRRFGTRRVFIMSMISFIPVFMIFPMVSFVAKKWAVSWGVWVLVTLILFLLFFMDTAYGKCSFIRIIVTFY